MIRAYFRIFGIGLTCLSFGLFSCICAFGVDENYTRKIVGQNSLINQGRGLVEAGQFNEGLSKFYEALDANYIIYDSDRTSPIGYIVRTLILLGEYEKALHECQWFVNRNKRNDEAKILAKQILRLKEYQSSGDATIVQRYINFYMKRKSKSLPPSFEWGAGPSEVATVLRLYNTIGDHDAGIKFIDEVLKWSYVRPKSDLKNIEHPASAAEALSLGKLGEQDFKKRDPEWRAYKLVWDYLTVREAFEQDKSDGFKGCAHSPPGQVCMGKATKALIQSDYFPW